jgi:hypothetical protein
MNLEDLKDKTPDEIRQMRVILIPNCDRCPNCDHSFKPSCVSRNDFVKDLENVDPDCKEMTFEKLLQFYLEKTVDLRAYKARCKRDGE